MIRFTGDPRINWSKKHEEIYHTLREQGIFAQHAQTFMFFASLGFKYNRKLPVDNSSNDFRLTTFTENELIPYLTISFAVEGIQLAKLGRIEVFKSIVEKYAEGGIQVFIEKFLEPYLITNADGSYILDIKTGVTDFEKDLLVFIYEESQEVDIFM